MSYRITGRVQGVGFRAWAVREAQQRALRGWVRNARDGSVELEIEGTAEAVADMRARLAEGPRLARVDAVMELPPTGRDLGSRFEVAH